VINLQSLLYLEITASILPKCKRSKDGYFF
jgi:hypothetical protein